MARLTFGSVQAYATECGYTVEKKSKGYLLNGHVVPTLVKIVEVIKEGDLLDGEFSPLSNIEIEESEITEFCQKYHTHCSYSVYGEPKPQYCGLVFDADFYTYELTEIYLRHNGNSKNAIPEMTEYCKHRLVFRIKSTINHKAEVTEIVNRVNDVWDRFSPKDDEIDTVIKIARALHTLNNNCRDNDWHNRPVQMPSQPGFWEYAWECFNKYRVIEECKPILKSHGIGCYHRHISCTWIGDAIAKKHGQQKRFWWQDNHVNMTDIKYWNTVKELLSA